MITTLLGTTRQLAVITATVGLLWLTAASTRADDSGKRSLVKVFAPAVSKAVDATVRVRLNNKDAILGTVIDKNGYILTKGSELGRKAAISVRFRDGTEYDAEYVGYHEASDLALLKVDVTDAATIEKFSPGKEATVGNFVATVGFESDPVAVGIVSVGVRKLYGEESFIDNLNKGYIGIEAAPAKEGDEGVVINLVQENGAAWKAKLKKGDQIVEIAGKAVKQFADMRKILEDYSPGDKVELLIRRDGDEKKVTVKLTSRADFNRGDYQNTLSGGLSARRTGFPLVITHDSVLKPEQCGGPLVDADGRVLGINIARAGRVETWTLPAEVINRVLPDLKAGKLPPPAKVVANVEKK